jgi:hypothetical protein
VIAGVVLAIAYLSSGVLIGRSAEEALGFAIRMVAWIAGSLALAALVLAMGRAWERSGPVARAIRASEQEATRVRVRPVEAREANEANESAVEIEVGAQRQKHEHGG